MDCLLRVFPGKLKSAKNKVLTGISKNICRYTIINKSEMVKISSKQSC